MGRTASGLRFRLQQPRRTFLFAQPITGRGPNECGAEPKTAWSWSASMIFGPLQLPALVRIVAPVPAAVPAMALKPPVWHKSMGIFAPDYSSCLKAVWVQPKSSSANGLPRRWSEVSIETSGRYTNLAGSRKHRSRRAFKNYGRNLRHSDGTLPWNFLVWTTACG